MENLGIFSFGMSVGIIVGISIFRQRTSSGLGQFLMTLLPLLFVVGVYLPLPNLNDVKSFSLFPVGLLLSLMWLYASEIIANREPKLRVIFDYSFCIATLCFAGVALFHISKS